MTLARECIKIKDWGCAAKTSDALLKADIKKTYPAIHLHQAVARFGLKDYDGALASVQEAIRLDTAHLSKRADYVLGRTLEPKGDLTGDREHMTAYLTSD